MTYNQLVTLTTLISAAQGISFVDESKKQVWFSLLEDLDFEIAHLALKKLLRTEEFNITPAHIRKACVEITEPHIDVAAAWRLLQTIISGFGRYECEAAMVFAEMQDGILHQIIKEIGFIEICNSNPEFFRSEFEKLYREAVKTSTQNRMLSDRVRGSIGELRNRIVQKNLGTLMLEDDAYGM